MITETETVRSGARSRKRNADLADKDVEIKPDSKMAAMIAYLQSLGHLRDMAPVAPTETALTK